MSFNLLIGLILSLAIGLSLGLIGGGGSIVTVPVLVYVIGIDPRAAIAMSLAVVGVTSLIGALLHYRQGTVDIRTGLLFGLAGILGAYPGSKVTYLFAPAMLMLIFAVLMLVIAALMLLRKSADNRPAASSISKAMMAGLTVGLLTGFLGVGGGFLIVPALVLFSGLAIKEAIGTSLLIISINCAAGLISHLSHQSFNIRLTLLVTALAAVGTVIGTQLSHRIAPDNLKKSFSYLVILVALFLIMKNYNILLP